jgi:RimJ/RimL family protein N-acetyltransferase
MGQVPTLETARLLLRDWRDEDVEPYVQMNADSRVTEFFAQPYSRERSEANAKTIRASLAADGYGWWAVEIRGGAPFAGLIALTAVPFRAPFTPAKEIGWRFASKYWGRGYATEAARAALDFAFRELDWREVVAFTAVPNVRSRRVMERLGMTHDSRDDFDHPRIEPDHPLLRHVLYRIKRTY